MNLDRLFTQNLEQADPINRAVAPVMAIISGFMALDIPVF